MMGYAKNKLLCSLILISTCPAASLAADMFGNPTQIGTPGKFEIQIGGGVSSNIALDSNKSTGTLQIGTVSGSQSMPPFSDTLLKEDNVFIGLSYSFNARSQLFAHLGTGKNTRQQSSRSTIGVKILPGMQASELKMGLMLRAQQVTTNSDGLFFLPYPYARVTDGVNNIYVTDVINGTEQIKYTRIDAFFGASASTGVVRPYGGLCLSRISGTDTVALDGMTTVWSNPIAGGMTTYSTQHVTFNAQSDITGRRYFNGVLGLSFNPDDDLGMTAELQVGVQQSFMLAGNIRF
ncbi:MAG: hypothetical protein HY016_12295 [Nitrosomonadales bacterium]|nr:hypothetical protein [Nitrosomonadales bacterium]